VATLSFSQRAEADLLEIGAYTLQTWGADQTIRYLDQLESCCRRLAEIQRWGGAAMKSAPACAEWNKAGM
jgi:plasmid stabilization system protein ParE